MQRHERIRYYISHQCKELDKTYRCYLYPKQILLGNVQLPHLAESPLTFRVNSKNRICFRIRLNPDESTGMEPVNIGIPLTNLIGLSMKDTSKRHPNPAIVFRLKNSAQQKILKICEPIMKGQCPGRRGKQMTQYLTVICGTDPKLAVQPNKVFCRVVVLANKFTFPFDFARNMLFVDLKEMWERAVPPPEKRDHMRTNINVDYELISEFCDDGWTWLMKFLCVKWRRHPCSYGRQYLLVRDEEAYAKACPESVNNENHQNDGLMLLKRESPTIGMPENILEEEMETAEVSELKRVKIEDPDTLVGCGLVKTEEIDASYFTAEQQ